MPSSSRPVNQVKSLLSTAAATVCTMRQVMEGVGMHFDSLRNDEISPPLQPIGWKFELDYFIDWAMRTHLPASSQRNPIAHSG